MWSDIIKEKRNNGNKSKKRRGLANKLVLLTQSGFYDHGKH